MSERTSLPLPDCANIAFARKGPVVELRLHSDNGPLRWSRWGGVNVQLPEAFAAIRNDRSIGCVILTGTGDIFCNELDQTGEAPPPLTAASWDIIAAQGRALLDGLMAIEVPVIGVVNGPAWIHAELIAMSDIVLAAPEASFADKVHAVNGVVPGDGAQIWWPMVLGANRARHFLLTGAEIAASEALSLGIVAEVHPRAALLERAWTLAGELAARPAQAGRYTRLALTLDIRRRLAADLSYGLMLEGMGLLSRT